MYNPQREWKGSIAEEQGGGQFPISTIGQKFPREGWFHIEYGENC